MSFAPNTTGSGVVAEQLDDLAWVCVHTPGLHFHHDQSVL